MHCQELQRLPGRSRDAVAACCCCSRPGEGAGGGARAVAETVQHFITAMDSLKLNLVAVDQVSHLALAQLLLVGTMLHSSIPLHFYHSF